MSLHEVQYKNPLLLLLSLANPIGIQLGQVVTEKLGWIRDAGFQCISWKVELVKNQVLWHQLQTIHVEFPCPGSCSQTKNTYLRSREILYAFAALPFLFATLIIPWDI